MQYYVRQRNIYDLRSSSVFVFLQCKGQFWGDSTAFLIDFGEKLRKLKI